MKDTNIYLDVDGTIIHEDIGNYNKPAAHLKEFLEVLDDYPVYWLTTHCREGNSTFVLRHLQNLLPADLFQHVIRFQPTTWNRSKTEGIDFSHPNFLWFDDHAFSDDFKTLAQHHAISKYIEVNLTKNPDQLLDIVRNVFL